MYSQLFDDEWSEAFEALKNIADGNEDDDDIFPDTLFILQNIVTVMLYILATLCMNNAENTIGKQQRRL